MTNDTSTLSGSLDEMKDQLISELGDKGVTATFDSTTGLLGLVSKIGDIQTGGGTSCPKLVQGTFTTGSTRAGTGTVNISYTGTGYPIAVMVYMQSGTYDPDDTWYNTLAQYDADGFMAIKAQMSSTPTFVSSGSVPANQAAATVVYKSNASTATTHTRSGSQSAVMYNSSDASTGYNCIRFKNSTKVMSYYIGNSASNRVGLAPSKTYAYIVIYSQ
jgi:hypothetical protein